MAHDYCGDSFLCLLQVHSNAVLCGAPHKLTDPVSSVDNSADVHGELELSSGRRGQTTETEYLESLKSLFLIENSVL